jgi:hypothetical protein
MQSPCQQLDTVIRGFDSVCAAHFAGCGNICRLAAIFAGPMFDTYCRFDCRVPHRMLGDRSPHCRPSASIAECRSARPVLAQCSPPRRSLCPQGPPADPHHRGTPRILAAAVAPPRTLFLTRTTHFVKSAYQKVKRAPIPLLQNFAGSFV